MKLLTSLLLLLLTSLFYISCEHQLSSEEGEVFLQIADEERLSVNATDTLLAYRLSLFAAERKYDFTAEQLLRLKRIQLKKCGALSKELGQRLMHEVEALATKTGNDSLLRAVGWEIFSVCQQQQDTLAALRVMKQQEPLELRLHGSDAMSRYYYAIAFIHNYHNNPEGYLYWIRKARPQQEKLLHRWYNMISEAYLKAGYNQEAIVYADSAILNSSKDRFRNTGVSQVKGEALVRLSHTDEALSWYASTIRLLDSDRLKSNNTNYSLEQNQMIFAYASLLYKTGKTPEAIRELEKIVDYSHPYFRRSKYDSDWQRYRVSTVRLMADCYQAVRSMEQYRFYTRQADSLQSVLNKEQLEMQRSQSGEELQNKLLKEELDRQLQGYNHARSAQYILAGVVLLLLAMIIAGILLWRKRQRRLAELFNLLIRRHEYWLEQHHIPAALPPYEVPAAETLNDSTGGNENYYRLFYHVLQVMENKKPFLNPDMDLIALSRSVATNRSTLSAAINSETGMSFSNWLAEYRVNYLLRQLPFHKDKFIDELYPLAGFSSRSSFFRQFRQITGMTPYQYMTRLKKQ